MEVNGSVVSPGARFCNSDADKDSVRDRPRAIVRVVDDQPAADVIEDERKTLTALFAISRVRRSLS